MNEKYAALFTPFNVGNVEIKNRIVMCSMGGTSLYGWFEPCHFDKEAAYFLLEKARNNVGLCLPGMQCIRDLIGKRWLYTNDRMFRDTKEYMKEYHKTGGKLFIQLAAGMGRSMALNDQLVKVCDNKILSTLANPIIDGNYVCASSSRTPNRWVESYTSHELTTEQIQEMVYAFGQTAKKLREADIDGVEIHAVHEGYLLDQFAIANWNHRTDQYGGSFENRYRFATEIVQEIKKETGEDFPVSLRYSVVSKCKDFGKGAVPGEEFEEFGRDMEESEKAVKYLQDSGYDMLNCDNGTYDSWYWAHPPQYMPNNCNLEDVEHIRKFVTIPVVCAGKMEPEVAAKEIKAGRLDAVAIARQNLVDPEWVIKIQEGREEEIKPCIRCHNACFPFSKYDGTGNKMSVDDTLHLARCALTPPTMQHNRYKVVPTHHPKKVAIIGGGIGGLECALMLKKRGHNPVVFEKTGEMHFTPPVQTVYAAIQGLKEYFEEGEMEKWARHLRVNKAIHEGLARLGLKEAIDPTIQSGLVVSVLYPDDPNWDFEKVHDYCYQRGFTIYPGKIEKQGTFRLCALGAINASDIEEFWEIINDHGLNWSDKDAEG